MPHSFTHHHPVRCIFSSTVYSSRISDSSNLSCPGAGTAIFPPGLVSLQAVSLSYRFCSRCCPALHPPVFLLSVIITFSLVRLSSSSTSLIYRLCFHCVTCLLSAPSEKLVPFFLHFLSEFGQSSSKIGSFVRSPPLFGSMIISGI